MREAAGRPVLRLGRTNWCLRVKTPAVYSLILISLWWSFLVNSCVHSPEMGSENIRTFAAPAERIWQTPLELKMARLHQRLRHLELQVEVPAGRRAVGEGGAHLFEPELGAGPDASRDANRDAFPPLEVGQVDLNGGSFRSIHR